MIKTCPASKTTILREFKKHRIYFHEYLIFHTNEKYNNRLITEGRYETSIISNPLRFCTGRKVINPPPRWGDATQKNKKGYFDNWGKRDRKG